MFSHVSLVSLVCIAGIGSMMRQRDKFYLDILSTRPLHGWGPQEVVLEENMCPNKQRKNDQVLID